MYELESSDVNWSLDLDVMALDLTKTNQQRLLNSETKHWLLQPEVNEVNILAVYNELYNFFQTLSQIWVNCLM